MGVLVGWKFGPLEGQDEGATVRFKVGYVVDKPTEFVGAVESVFVGVCDRSIKLLGTCVFVCLDVGAMIDDDDETGARDGISLR